MTAAHGGATCRFIAERAAAWNRPAPKTDTPYPSSDKVPSAPAHQRYPEDTPRTERER